jgi:hypothetical protein
MNRPSPWPKQNPPRRGNLDVTVPDHPLSRARALLDHVERTLAIETQARESAPFQPPRKPWWKLW